MSDLIQTISKYSAWGCAQSREAGERRSGGLRGVVFEGCYYTSWAEMRSSCRVLCYFQLSPLPILPSHFPKHCLFTLRLPRLPRMNCSSSSASGRGYGETAKWAVIGQLPALVSRPPDPHLCVFQAAYSSAHSDLDFALKPPSHPSFSPPFSLSAWLSICFW